MIGRDGPVKPFELIRWARAQAAACELAELEAHLLLVLATYADDQATCWPKLKQLQADTRRGRSQVIAAMRRLEDLQLVWSEQAGRGRAARRELLFNPASSPADRTADARANGAGQTSSSASRTAGARSASPLAVRPTGPAAVRAAGPHRVNGQKDGQNSNDRAAAVAEELTNGQMTQSDTPDCRQPAANDGHRKQAGPRPIGDVLADLQLQLETGAP